MRRLRVLAIPAALLSVLFPQLSQGAPWVENQIFFAEGKNLGSSMVDAADLDNDGYIDLVFANGLGYNKGGADSDLKQQAFHNSAGVSMVDVTQEIFGGAIYNGRAVKLRDVDGDGDIDIVLGTTWQTQSQLFINDGLGIFSNETATHLPQLKTSVGDVELGDIDDDGDLDMLLADWGTTDVVDELSAGGVTQVWTQMGVNTGMFEDDTLARMAAVELRWAWDIDLVDVDNDYDLDLVASCFACTDKSLYLFANDGSGHFSDVTGNIKDQGLQGVNVESVDLNGDSFLDLVSLHDGVGGRNRVLLNDTMGSFADQSNQVWPQLENPASYDQMSAVLDYNSDGLPDLAVGAFQPGASKYPDRLMQNQGDAKNPKLIQNTAAFEEIKASPGTYAIVLADLNLDRILDLAMSQNENSAVKKVLLGNGMELAPDTAAPQIPIYQKLADDLEFGQSYSLKLRAHDTKTPVMAHDFQRQVDEYIDGRPYVESWNTDPGADLEANPGQRSAHGVWYGEALWKISVMVPDEPGQDRFAYRICAIDAAHNKACTGLETIDKPVEATTGPVDPTLTTGEPSTDSGATDSATGPMSTTMVPTSPTGDSFPDPGTSSSSSSSSDGVTTELGELDDDGCGCDAGGSPVQGMLGSLALLGLLGLRRGHGGRRRGA